MMLRLIHKTTDQSVAASTVPQNDGELAVALDAGSTYQIQYALYYTAPTGGDLKWQWSAPADLVGREGALRLSNTVTTSEGYARGSAAAFTAGATTPLSAGGTGNHASVLGALLVETQAAGTLQLKWAQETSHPTPTTLHAYSHLVVTKF